MINVFKKHTHLCAITTSVFLFLQGMDTCVGSYSGAGVVLPCPIDSSSSRKGSVVSPSHIRSKSGTSSVLFVPPSALPPLSPLSPPPSPLSPPYICKRDGAGNSSIHEINGYAFKMEKGGKNALRAGIPGSDLSGMVEFYGVTDDAIANYGNTIVDFDAINKRKSGYGTSINTYDAGVVKTGDITINGKGITIVGDEHFELNSDTVTINFSYNEKSHKNSEVVSAVLAGQNAIISLGAGKQKETTIKAFPIGLEAYWGGKISMTGGRIDVFHVGAVAGSGASIHLKDTRIVLDRGPNAAGLVSQNGTITMGSGSITLRNGIGVQSGDGGRVNLNKVQIDSINTGTPHFYSTAFLVENGGSIEFRDGTVKVNTQNGLQVFGNGNIALHNSVIEVASQAAYGMYFSGLRSNRDLRLNKDTFLVHVRPLELQKTAKMVKDVNAGIFSSRSMAAQPAISPLQMRTKGAGFLDRKEITLTKTIFDVKNGTAIYNRGNGVANVILNKGSRLSGDLLLQANNRSQTTISVIDSSIVGGVWMAPTSQAKIYLYQNSEWSLVKAPHSNRNDIRNCLDSCVSLVELKNSAIRFVSPKNSSDKYQTLRIGHGSGEVYKAGLERGGSKIYFNVSQDFGNLSNNRVADRLLIHGDVFGKTTVYVQDDSSSGLQHSDFREDNTKGRSVSLIQVYGGGVERDSFQLSGGYTTLNNSPYKYVLNAHGPFNIVHVSHSGQSVSENGKQFWDFRLENQPSQPERSNSAPKPVGAIPALRRNGASLDAIEDDSLVTVEAPSFDIIPDGVFINSVMNSAAGTANANAHTTSPHSASGGLITLVPAPQSTSSRTSSSGSQSSTSRTSAPSQTSGSQDSTSPVPATSQDSTTSDGTGSVELTETQTIPTVGSAAPGTTTEHVLSSNASSSVLRSASSGILSPVLSTAGSGTSLSESVLSSTSSAVPSSQSHTNLDTLLTTGDGTTEDHSDDSYYVDHDNIDGHDTGIDLSNGQNLTHSYIYVGRDGLLYDSATGRPVPEADIPRTEAGHPSVIGSTAGVPGVGGSSVVGSEVNVSSVGVGAGSTTPHYQDGSGVGSSEVFVPSTSTDVTAVIFQGGSPVLNPHIFATDEIISSQLTDENAETIVGLLSSQLTKEDAASVITKPVGRVLSSASMSDFVKDLSLSIGDTSIVFPTLDDAENTASVGNVITCSDNNNDRREDVLVPYRCHDGSIHKMKGRIFKMGTPSVYAVRVGGQGEARKKTTVNMDEVVIRGVGFQKNLNQIYYTDFVSAVLAEKGAEISSGDSRIYDFPIGIEARSGGQIKMADGMIDVLYAGVIASGGSTIRLHNTKINVKGFFASAGLSSNNNGMISMDYGSIRVEKGVAVIAELGGRVKLENVNLIGKPRDVILDAPATLHRTAFLLSDGGVVSFDRGTVITDGAGVWFRDNFTNAHNIAKIENSVVTVNGNGSLGIYFDGTENKVDREKAVELLLGKESAKPSDDGGALNMLPEDSGQRNVHEISRAPSRGLNVGDRSSSGNIQSIRMKRHTVESQEKNANAATLTASSQKENSRTKSLSEVFLPRTKFTVPNGVAVYSMNSIGRIALKDKSALVGDALLRAKSSSDVSVVVNDSMITGDARIDKSSRAKIELLNRSEWLLSKSKNEHYRNFNFLCSDSCVSFVKLSDSAIRFVPSESDSHSYQTLRIGTGDGVVYHALDDARIYFNAYLDPSGRGDDQVTDRLLIHGDVDGKTTVHVRAVAGTDGKNDKIVHGVSLIQVHGHAQKDSFQLDGEYVTLDNSPYKYTLRSYGPTARAGTDVVYFDPTLAESGKDFWEFRLENQYVALTDSAYVSTAPKRTSPIDTLSTSDSENVVKSVVPQVPTYLLLPNTLFHTGLMDINNQNRQLETIRNTKNGLLEVYENPTVFLRGYGGSYRYNSDLSAAEYGYAGDFGYHAIEAGASLYTIENAYSTVSFGVIGSYGRFSVHPLDVEQSQKSEFDKWSVTAYSSVQNDEGFYADGLLSYGIFKGDVSTLARGTTATLKGNPLSASLTGGKAFDIGYEGFVWDPQVQVVYQHLGFNKTRDIDNFDIDMGKLNQWVVRVGGRLTKNPVEFEDERAVFVYGKLHLTHNFGKKQSVHFKDSFQLGSYGSSIEAGLGVNIKFYSHFALHGDFVYQHKLNKAGFSGASFSGGLRYQF
ncbi:autotransporter outer membrane beta-barrel domain-containing protein [Bartonella sp. CB189]|uniref:autotransporter outer membrane beta-barrel domain-containing protein n=1 Tax=Bartonella sp. CB189 TaxID=3112254 RepID=UPI002F9677D2